MQTQRISNKIGCRNVRNWSKRIAEDVLNLIINNERIKGTMSGNEGTNHTDHETPDKTLAIVLYIWS